jgi:predicted P-loop ATPase
MEFNGKHSHAFNHLYDKYIFRFNVVTSFYEFKKRKKRKWVKYDDRHRKTILFELMQESLDCPSDKFDIFIESADFSPDFNPFDAYFNDLKPHKGKKSYIKELAKTITTNGNAKHFHKTLERFLVGSLDCLLNEDSVNDVCLVFQSPQGIGKTRWMRSLLPKAFQSEYLYEGNIDTKNKDHTMYLSQYWFIHLDELEALKSNDISAIKSYITRQRISVRKAYGRYKTNMVRRSSFLGSVNADKFLSDITGNRRWLVFKVDDINYMHGIDPDKIWAEAYKLYKKGYRHWFDIEEIKAINSQNERFRAVSLEEELFLRYFSCNALKKGGEFLSSSEVIEKILWNVQGFSSKMSSPQMGRSLSKHSKGSQYTKGITRYWVEYNGEKLAPVNSPSLMTGNSVKNKPIDEDDDLPF